MIEDLLAQQNYAESVTVVKETLNALLQSKRGDVSWTPEASLLIANGGFYVSNDREKVKTLLSYYQQTAQGLDQSERVNALEVQRIAIEQCSNWSSMFEAFTEIPVSEQTRQALFESWREHIVRQSKPHTWGFGTAKTDETWWPAWLIDSIADPQKGANWFQQNVISWLANLSGDKTHLGEEYNLLRLLTKDLTEIRHKGQSPYPQFYQAAIRPRELSTPNDESRQTYLQQYAAADLWDQVMDYWRVQLPNFIPKPELARNSDYTEHAQWMAALKKLSLPNYKTLLAQWRIDHQRRRNLWKAIDKAGIIQN